MFLPPLLLVTSCFSLFFFRKFIGPYVLFLTAVISLTLTLVSTLSDLIITLREGSYFVFDLGRWFYLYDILESNLLFMVDSLSLVTTLVVVTLTLLAQLFGLEYMYREAFLLRLLYLLNLFATSVVFLFFVYDFFLVLVVWECIGLFSLFLVNFYSSRVYTVKAALKTFIFSRVSDFFICIAFFVLVVYFSTSDFSIIFLKVPFLSYSKIYIFNCGISVLELVAFSILVSSAVKAAQFGFHV